MDCNDDDIKTECVEIVSEVVELDATSLTADGETSVSPTILSPFVFERNEREIVIRFIEMVRVCPEIWDMTSAAYREKILRRRSLRKIGEQIGWSQEEVLKKYNNLRTYYTKELIKARKNANYISKWPYFDQLDSFMRTTVHIRQQKHKFANKSTRMWSNRNTSDRYTNYGRTSTGIRRLASGSTHNVRQRTGTQRRLHQTGLAAPTLVVSTSTPTQLHSSTPSIAAITAPTVDIPPVVVHSMQTLKQRERERQSRPVERVPVSRSPRIQAQPTQPPKSDIASTTLAPLTLSKSSQITQQHSHHKAGTQGQHEGVNESLPQVQHVWSQANEHSPQSVQPSSSFTSSALPSTSSNEMETSDTIFGKLIASQLAKIKEGRKKEQLKISLMQQIVQAMFDDGDS